MDRKLNALQLLDHIDPSLLNYQEWINVGMALKEEGYTAQDWDTWSQRDTGRYRKGECFSKWFGFQGTGQPVTGGTIYQYAKEQGWRPEKTHDEGYALDWDSEIKDELVFIDKNWIEEKEVTEPVEWNPVKDLITYLETLFEASENVGYVTATYEVEEDGKVLHKPTKGNWDRTAGQLIELLSKCNGDIGAVLGDYKEEAGAWIRFNPLDGKGAKNENVSDFKYALVESDSMEISQQNAILRELELPIAALVHSGNKSLHAIVKIEAPTYEEYRKRVDLLYQVCLKNGLNIDRQNKNPSRLSRMPGVTRNGHKQYLIDTNIGKSSWTEWKEYIESVNDDLPDPDSLLDIWDNMPELAPPLIEGVLRQGHKMLIAGPSKAGKSFALIEMCIAIAEGREWMGWNCSKGKVLYVNLELDKASCFHRFRDVYTSLGYKGDNIGNIDIWNLRGKSTPMDTLAPKLIRRALKKNYIAIVIDPIYKVITGDENSASEMAKFTNQFDKICTELNTAVIYCHHHSKGYQGSKKAADRSSGSGVFARDPDAIMDLIELELNDHLITQEENKIKCSVAADYIRKTNFEYYRDEIGQDDLLSPVQMKDHAEKVLSKIQLQELSELTEEALKTVGYKSAWRIDGTLREYPKFEPKDIWFEYPIHKLDNAGSLRDLQPEGEKPDWKKAQDNIKSPEDKKTERINAIEIAFTALEMDNEPITATDLAEEMGVTKRTVWNRIKEHGGFDSRRDPETKESFITRKCETGK